MKILKKLDFEHIYLPAMESFYLSDRWINCREVFAGKINRKKKKNFYFSTDKIGRLKKFIEIFENKIKIRKKTRFVDTDKPKIIFIKPAKFWKHCKMRMSLFTALLRCGTSYTSNFESALYSRSYTSLTKAAVERFLDGYQIYTGKRTGWLGVFENCSKERIEILLVKK